MAKVRIYQLAKELGMENAQLLEVLDQMGVSYKSHASTLEDETAQAVKEIIAEQRGLEEQRRREEEAKRAEEARKALPHRPPRGGHHGSCGPRQDQPARLPAQKPHRREGGGGDHPARGGFRGQDSSTRRSR